MTARTGMANVIQRLRNLAQAGTADYNIAGVTYWSDDDLQEVLDAHRVDVFSERLETVATLNGSGTPLYVDYYATPGCYEEGTAQFQITDALGSAVTPAAVNYPMGHVSFGTVNQAGTPYYLTARRFDLNAAAAAVWRRKAGQVATAYDFTADGQSMSRSQLQRQYLEMAKQFAALAEPVTVTLRRG